MYAATMRTFVCIFVRNVNRICVSKFQNVPHNIEHWNIRLLGVPSILAFSHVNIWFSQKPSKIHTNFRIYFCNLNSYIANLLILRSFIFSFSRCSVCTWTTRAFVLSNRLYKEAICIYQWRSMAIQFNFHNDCACDSFWFPSVFMRSKIPILPKIIIFKIFAHLNHSTYK